MGQRKSETFRPGVSRGTGANRRNCMPRASDAARRLSGKCNFSGFFAYTISVRSESTEQDSSDHRCMSNKDPIAMEHTGGHPRPFRFGITSTGAPTRQAWVAMARKAEAQGYATMLISDHIYNQIGPLAALAVAAESTTTLRVGSFLFDNDFRHPLFLAQEAASVDLLSSGRFELGIGAGYQRPDYVKSGIPFDAPGVRVARLQEAVHVIKGCWAEGPFTYSGQHYKITDVTLLPKPAQKPRPPILIGAGSQRLLSFAAREADIIGINFKNKREGGADLADIGPEAFDQRVAWVRQAAGDRFDALELNTFTFVAAVTDQRRKAVQTGFVRFGQTIDDQTADALLESPHVLVGTVEQIVADLRLRRDRFGISYIVLHQRDWDAFAPVVERLAGT